MAGSALIVEPALAEFNFGPLRPARHRCATPARAGVPRAGSKYGVYTTSKIDFRKLGIALVLGTAGLPHILIRFYTVPTSRDARKSVLWADLAIGAFYLFTLVLGFGAGAARQQG